MSAGQMADGSGVSGTVLSMETFDDAASVGAAPGSELLSEIARLAHDPAGLVALLGPGALAIVAERLRQIADEGFSPERDRELYTTELARASQSYVAAALYAQATGAPLGLPPDSWPWPDELFKPSADPARNLEKAGALIAAELDRLR